MTQAAAADSRNLYSCFAFGRTEQSGPFKRLTIRRNECGPDDVELSIKYCGVCHSDVHLTENQLGTTRYPIVPGHELAGLVTAVGCNVSRFRLGDRVGVGCIVDSCMECESCEDSEEQGCIKKFTMAYSYDTAHGHLATDSGYTFGGYSEKYTLHQRYVVKVPASFPLEFAGPILCAGITMYSPLKHWKALKGGLNVGVVGIGGLGQMGIRLANAMGNTVTAISTSPNKENVAKAIGARHFVVSSDADSMVKAAGSLDLILNTVSAPHQAAVYLRLLRRDGTLVQLGLVTESHKINQMMLIGQRLSLSGSCIGGMRDTQEVIDFCHEHDVKPDIEVVGADKLDAIYKLLSEKNDSIKRYVLDIELSAKNM